MPPFTFSCSYKSLAYLSDELTDGCNRFWKPDTPPASVRAQQPFLLPWSPIYGTPTNIPLSPHSQSRHAATGNSSFLYRRKALAIRAAEAARPEKTLKQRGWKIRGSE
jgi:hypothetical protein